MGRPVALEHECDYEYEHDYDIERELRWRLISGRWREVQNRVRKAARRGGAW